MTKPNRENEIYIYELVSKNIKKYRQMRGLTQNELANMIPYSYATITSIEGNYRNNFSLAVISSIAKALNIKTYLLFMEDEEIKDFEKKQKNITQKV